MTAEVRAEDKNRLLQCVDPGETSGKNPVYGPQHAYVIRGDSSDF